nr:non-homologous end-joining DNA ligase [Pseudoruegeria sp. HB172150]
MRGVHISHPSRVVFPEADLTKADVAKHYDLVAEVMMDSLSNRPVSFLRCPSGIEGDCFFQKHLGKGFPQSIETVPIEESDGETEDYMVLSHIEAVLGAVQMGTIEFHIWGAARDRLNRPDRMVFDLDPDESLQFYDVRKAALDVREALADIGLEAGTMVTGGKGVHVIVPLRRIADWETVGTFAKIFARTLSERYPDRFTAKMSKTKRKGRIFVDWLRNCRGATAIAPYSLRARSGAPVAVPVAWDELARLERADGFSVADMRVRLDAGCPLSEVPKLGLGKSTMKALTDWADG